MTIRETEIEKYLISEIKVIGGWAIKIFPIVISGLPDRLILIRGTAWFVETKKPKGGIISKLQKVVAKLLNNVGFDVHYLFTKSDVDEFILMLEL